MLYGILAILVLAVSFYLRFTHINAPKSDINSQIKQNSKKLGIIMCIP